METVTLSTRYRLVIPRRVRERLHLAPGTKFTVLAKGEVLFLVPQRPLSEQRGSAKGVGLTPFREKVDRL